MIRRAFLKSVAAALLSAATDLKLVSPTPRCRCGRPGCNGPPTREEILKAIEEDIAHMARDLFDHPQPLRWIPLPSTAQERANVAALLEQIRDVAGNDAGTRVLPAE